MPFGFAKDEINNTVCGHLHAYFNILSEVTTDRAQDYMCSGELGGGGGVTLIVWLALMVCQKLLWDL